MGAAVDVDGVLLPSIPSIPSPIHGSSHRGFDSAEAPDQGPRVAAIGGDDPHPDRDHRSPLQAIGNSPQTPGASQKADREIRGEAGGAGLQ